MLDLNGRDEGSISQVLATQRGQHYVLSFKVSGNFIDGPPLKSMEVLWAPYKGGVQRVAQHHFLTTGGLTRKNLKWKASDPFSFLLSPLFFVPQSIV